MTEHDEQTPDGLDPEEHPVIDLTREIEIDLRDPEHGRAVAPTADEATADIARGPEDATAPEADQPDLVALLLEDSLTRFDG